ncbi:MAG TPA: amidase, partial [Candidatus Hydrogenedentes bacterium]|nr:amidase [Candidatus Hydrogenedentota bacterium]
MTDWRWADAVTVRNAVMAGTVSAEEVTRTLLDWIGEADPKVDAYTQIWSEEALTRAREIDAKKARGEQLGPLAGVPVGLKELLCTRQGFTTCASRILSGFRSPYDATVVRRLEAADAVFLGKVNMDEFAMGSSTERSAIKKTKNPWNLNCVPGGSSGGSAAAVASGQCAVSLGSDTGGS